ncbi:MAG TPA: SMP-30/gluconolactonase/LRE family protein [Acidobacteriaceae bacterium]|jgi:gluconolactonase
MKRSAAVFAALFAAACFAGAFAQQESDVIRLDPGLDAIISANGKLEVLPDSEGLGTREGPTWIRQGGYLIYSDLHAKTINKWDPRENKITIFEKDTNSDGVTLDHQDRLVWAAKTPSGGTIVRLEKNGQRTVLASEYQGKPLSGPNDLVYKSDGLLYFTDPDRSAPRVYLLKGGQVTLATAELPHPNGLAFSPGEKQLYINDSSMMTVTRYDVKPDGSIANPKIVIDMNAGQEPCAFPCPEGYPDGMKVDRKGNIYVTGRGGIWIVSPEGKHLGTIAVPNHPANLAFGGPDGKTLFFTARPGLYRIRLNASGIQP